MSVGKKAQGGLTYESGKLGILTAAQGMLNTKK